MIKGPLVSVGIPVYNGEKNIKRCLTSIVNQTYKNLEILIIDDNSTDNSFKILKKFISKRKNIKIFKNKKNMGISYTYSKLAKIAKGKFFAWNPQDDARSLNYFDSCIKEFLKDETIVLCHGTVKAFLKKKIYCENTINSYSNISNDLRRLTIFHKNFCDTSIYGLIKRKKLLKTSLFNQKSTAPANLLLSELILKGKFMQVNNCFFKYNGTLIRMGPKEEYWRHNKKRMPFFYQPSLFIFYRNLIYIITSKVKSKIKIFFYFFLISIIKRLPFSLNSNPDVEYKSKLLT